MREVVAISETAAVTRGDLADDPAVLFEQPEKFFLVVHGYRRCCDMIDHFKREGNVLLLG